MKCISFKLFILLSLVLLQGCMPDSLTKFKEESKPPQEAPQSSGGTVITEAPSDLSYSASSYTFTVANPIVDLLPSVTGTVTSYTINPSLPSGLTFNTSTGRISGTPVFYAAPANYIVTATNSIGSTTTTINVSAYNQPASIKYHLSPRIVVTMSSTSDLVVGGSFTTITGAGVIKQLAGNVVEVEMTSGYLSSGQIVVATGSPTISDLTYKNSIQLFPAQAASIGNFSIGSFVSSPASQGSSLGIVTQLLPDSIVVSMIRGTFAPSETLDNTATYASTEFVVQSINFLLNNGDSIDLRPTVGSGELIEYELVSGSLPSGFNAFSTLNGYITGSYQTSQTSVMTIKAKNPVGSANTTFTMGPLISSPQYLSLTQHAVIKVLSASNFDYGRYVSTPAGDRALVLKKIDSEHLYIRILNGTFDKEESLDNTPFFGGEKTVVVDLAYVSEVLRLGNGEAATFVRGGFISSNHGARGIVSHIDTSPANYDDIYVRTTQSGFISGLTPGVSSHVDNTLNFISSAGYIRAVIADHLSLTLDDVTSFNAGDSITQEYILGGLPYHSAGQIHDVNTVSNIVNISVDRAGFVVNEGVDNVNPFTGSVAIPGLISKDNTFYLQTGKAAQMNSTLLTGNNITYSITPDLPQGLTLNTQNGTISGTPAASTVKKAYTLTASNTIGGITQSTSISFNIKVNSVFSLANETEGASSYVLHRTGKGNEIADCMITEDQINGTNQSKKDITCLLDGSELDLYHQGLKTKAFSSKGLCKYVEVTPFGFWQWPYAKTTSNNTKIIVNGSCTGGDRTNYGLLTNNDGNDFTCLGDHTNINGPNCDDGTYTTITISFSDTDDPADGTCDADGTTITVTNNNPCGGNQMACFGGPSAQKYSLTDLSNGIRSTTTNTLNGAEISYEVKAPIEQGHSSNRAIANYTANNQCGDGDGYNYNTNNWKSYTTTAAIHALSGTVNINAYSNIVTGDPGTTAFMTELAPGDNFWVITGAAPNHEYQLYKVHSITDDETLQITTHVNAAVVGGAIARYEYSDPFRMGSQPYYEFACLDPADAPIARIRLLVRDWDKDFKVTDDIDILVAQLTGILTTNAATHDLNGIGTDFTNELTEGQMVRIGVEVNTIDSISTADTASLYLDNILTYNPGDNVIGVIRPPLSDAGEAVNLFNTPWNTRKDWDDRYTYHPDQNIQRNYPSLNSCPVATPMSTSLRSMHYPFPYDKL